VIQILNSPSAGPETHGGKELQITGSKEDAKDLAREPQQRNRRGRCLFLPATSFQIAPVGETPAMKASKPSLGPAYAFAMGDVHGCDWSLARFLNVCNDRGGNCLPRFVFLGDYIDRGRDSAAVLNRLMS
jgi:hypothetical protein